MRPRHAAALALVGWYLMVPLSSPRDPISQWYQVHSFDTAAQCNAVLEWEMTDDYAKQSIKAGQNPEHVKVYVQALQNAKCISTDDPRLKGN